MNITDIKNNCISFFNGAWAALPTSEEVSSNLRIQSYVIESLLKPVQEAFQPIQIIPRTTIGYYALYFSPLILDKVDDLYIFGKTGEKIITFFQKNFNSLYQVIFVASSIATCIRTRAYFKAGLPLAGFAFTLCTKQLPQPYKDRVLWITRVAMTPIVLIFGSWMGRMQIAEQYLLQLINRASPQQQPICQTPRLTPDLVTKPTLNYSTRRDYIREVGYYPMTQDSDLLKTINPENLAAKTNERFDLNPVSPSYRGSLLSRLTYSKRAEKQKIYEQLKIEHQKELADDLLNNNFDHKLNNHFLEMEVRQLLLDARINQFSSDKILKYLSKQSRPDFAKSYEELLQNSELAKMFCLNQEQIEDSLWSKHRPVEIFEKELTKNPRLFSLYRNWWVSWKNEHPKVLEGNFNFNDQFLIVCFLHDLGIVDAQGFDS